MLAATFAPDDVAWKIGAFLASQQASGSFTLEEVFERDRIDELQGLFGTSLRELDRALARADLAPKDIASVAHRIKGSAANLRMPELAARADVALTAARAAGADRGGLDEAIRALRRQIALVLRDLDAAGQSRLMPASINSELEGADVDDRTHG
ncbi:Hpt domain-containing protein [Bradyrhizobium sp. B117]|uniref:Hpt domain-containing protein n=1 Tax=Bradyrhizobium sp. B117 TaxID=3140246 RepID=UPI003183ED17